jgi:hypothetical protein
MDPPAAAMDILCVRPAAVYRVDVHSCSICFIITFFRKDQGWQCDLPNLPRMGNGLVFVDRHAAQRDLRAPARQIAAVYFCVQPYLLYGHPSDCSHRPPAHPRTRQIRNGKSACFRMDLPRGGYSRRPPQFRYTRQKRARLKICAQTPYFHLHFSRKELLTKRPTR